MKLRRYLTPVITCWAMISLPYVAIGGTKNLDFKKVKWSLMTLDDDTGGILIEKDRVLVWPQLGTSVAATPFNPKGTESKSAFSAKSSVYSPLTRITITQPQDNKPGEPGILKAPIILRGLVPFGQNQYIGIDSRDAQVMTFDSKMFAMNVQNQIILDLPLPPRDPRGEPTKIETANLRARLSRAIKKVVGKPLLAGFTAKPNYIKTSESYVVWSNIESFPLFLASCSNKDGVRCQLTRACDVSLSRGLDQAEWSGLAASEQRQRLYVGNRNGNSIEIFRGTACLNMTHEGSIKLPEELGSLRSIFVDTADRLWVTTQKPDNYLNASAYAWDSNDW